MQRICVLLALGGCSFLGARVPDRPPPPSRCPEGVVVADTVGALVTLGPGLAGAAKLAFGDVGLEGPLLVVLVPPLIVVGTVYAASAIYGARARSRCSRMQADLASPAPPPRAAETARKPVVGDVPLQCATSTEDIGRCFFAEQACAAEVARAGGSCEARTNGWCFDVGSVPGVTTTTCAATRIACDALRSEFTSDRTLSVTTCGSYAVREPSSAAP